MPAALVSRQRSFVTYEQWKVSVILGKNGIIFVEPLSESDEKTGGYVQDLEKVHLGFLRLVFKNRTLQVISIEQREMMCRVHNGICILADFNLQVSEKTIAMLVEATIDLQVPLYFRDFDLTSLLQPHEMHQPSIASQIAHHIHEKLR